MIFFRFQTSRSPKIVDFLLWFICFWKLCEIHFYNWYISPDLSLKSQNITVFTPLLKNPKYHLFLWFYYCDSTTLRTFAKFLFAIGSGQKKFEKFKLVILGKKCQKKSAKCFPLKLRVWSRKTFSGGEQQEWFSWPTRDAYYIMRYWIRNSLTISKAWKVLLKVQYLYWSSTSNRMVSSAINDKFDV